MANDDTVSLFTEALNVINASLAEHRDTQPYKAMLAASEKLLDDARIGVAVYKTEPSEPFDWFTICYRNGSFELVSHGKRDTDVAWRVSRDYLEKVAGNPREYIDHPVKLDWDWLKSRLGIGT